MYDLVSPLLADQIAVVVCVTCLLSWSLPPVYLYADYFPTE